MSDAMRNWSGEGFSADRARAAGNSSTTRIAARESNRSFAGLSLAQCSWIGWGETIGPRSLGCPSHSLKTGLLSVAKTLRVCRINDLEARLCRTLFARILSCLCAFDIFLGWVISALHS